MNENSVLLYSRSVNCKNIEFVAVSECAVVSRNRAKSFKQKQLYIPLNTFRPSSLTLYHYTPSNSSQFGKLFTFELVMDYCKRFFILTL